MVPQSSLAFYLEQFTKENNLAAVIVIMNGMTMHQPGWTKQQCNYSSN